MWLKSHSKRERVADEVATATFQAVSVCSLYLVFLLS